MKKFKQFLGDEKGKVKLVADFVEKLPESITANDIIRMHDEYGLILKAKSLGLILFEYPRFFKDEKGDHGTIQVLYYKNILKKGLYLFSVANKATNDTYWGYKD